MFTHTYLYACVSVSTPVCLVSLANKLVYTDVTTLIYSMSCRETSCPANHATAAEPGKHLEAADLYNVTSTLGGKMIATRFKDCSDLFSMKLTQEVLIISVSSLPVD